MKCFLTLAVAVTCCVALVPAAEAQDVRLQTVAPGLRNHSPEVNYNSDSYGRRLNRYQNNYQYNQGFNDGHNAGHFGHHNDGHYNDGHYNYGHNNYGYNNYGSNRSNSYNNYGYNNYDYYGGNYGRVNDYRGYYRTNNYRGFNNGYYSRPGFSIGGGSSRVFFGF